MKYIQNNIYSRHIHRIPEPKEDYIEKITVRKEVFSV